MKNFGSINILPTARRLEAMSPGDVALEKLQASLVGTLETSDAKRFGKIALGLESSSPEVEAELMGTHGEKLFDALESYAESMNYIEGSDTGVNAQNEEGYRGGLYTLNGECITDSSESERFDAVAAGMTAAGLSDPNEFYKQSKRTSQSSDGAKTVPLMVSGAGGNLPIVDSVGLESYDTSALNNYQALSVSFNGGGARQDPFGELFFPTKVLPTDQTGHELTIRPTMVMFDPKHSLDGSPTDFKRVRLMDAVRDDSILNVPVTDLIPFFNDTVNNEYFLDPAVVGKQDRKIEDITIPTGYLLTGKNMNLLGLTGHPGLLDNFILDHTDAIDPPLNVDEIVIEVTNGTDTEHFVLNTRMVNGTQFHTPAEGKGRDQVLTWNVSGGISFNKNTKLHNATPSTLLAPITTNEWTLSFDGLVGGMVNLEKGNLHIPVAPLTPASLKDSNGNELSLTTGAADAMLSPLTFTIVAFYPGGSRSNLNLRQRGQILTYESTRYRFAPPLQAPMSVVVPTSRTSGDAADVEALTSAVRVRNSNNAVITLFNYADYLRRNAIPNTGLVNGVEGPGADILTPIFLEEELDVDARTDTISSHERELDVNAILVNAIRDMAQTLSYRSGYETAIQYSSLGENVKPLLCVGTDPITQRYLTIKGDPRTAGITMDAQIATTINKRMREEGQDVAYIFLTFKRPGAGGQNIDPLSFGFHSWTPELVAVNNISKRGTHNRELTVQPRSMHFPVMPVLGVIKVVNLKKAATSA